MSNSLLRRLDLNLLVILRTVLETRNVTAAAERLHMSQPAVSRSIARLREVFQDPLFVKGARGVIATPRAEALSASVATLLADIDALVDFPGFDPQSTKRVFRVATTDYGAIAVMPDLVAAVAREAPLARIEVVPFSAEIFRRLTAGDVDLALYSDEPVPSGLLTKALFQEKYVSLLRTGHPLQSSLKPGRLSLQQFVAYPHILVSIFGGASGDVDAALAAHGLERRVAVVLPYFATAALLAAKTDLILTLPERASRQLADAHELVAMSPPVEVEGFGYQMVWHDRTDRDASCGWLRDTLSEPFSEALRSG